jgi:ABC-2 type transport system permease protein
MAQTEKVLRSLFWKLFFRGRVRQQAQGHKMQMRQASSIVMIGIYVILGVMPAIGVFMMDAFTFSAALHGMTLVLVLVNMASSAGSFLFNQEEAEILLHRPVQPAELLRAKVWVLVIVSLVLGLAFNLVGIFAGCAAKGGNWLFAPAHLVSLTLETVFATSLLVLIYNLCLRWFGRERLDNLMTTAQTLMTVILVAGGQLMPRLMEADKMSVFDSHKIWIWLLPTSWFAAFDAAVVSQGANPILWLPAFLALAMTTLTSWLALSKLAGSYGEGMVALNEAGPNATSAKPRQRWLRRLCKTFPLSLWLRDPIEQQSFLLTAAYMVRDRETKMRLYPGLAPMGAYMVVMLITAGGKMGSLLGPWPIAFASAYVGFLPMIAMDLLRMSEHWRASDVFRSVPLPHWSPLFHGARKAVMLFIILPAILVVLSVGLFTAGLSNKLAIMLPNVMLLPLWCLIPGVMGMWLPLSRPFDQQRQSGEGCLKMVVVMGSSMAVAGLGCYAYETGWLPMMLTVESIVVLALFFTFHRIIARSAWREE